MLAFRKLIIVLFFLLLFVSISYAASRTFRVEETDFVKITPTAVDPDNDKIVYTYSPPLDQEGEWQTNYGDAGEYNLDITASDGTNKVKETIKLVVADKNQAPFLKERKITVKETQTIELKTLVEDPDGDVLTYSFEPPFDKEGKWTTDFEDAGIIVINFKVDDGEFKVPMKAEIEILATNQPPIIKSSFSSNQELEIEEGKELDFFVNVIDNDGDEITYLWTLDGKKISAKERDKLFLDFNSSGEHHLNLEVKDGSVVASKKWIINVNNVNQPPSLTFEAITINEGEKIKFELPERDQEGDLLTYTFENPLNQNGEWQTDFDDAGKYKLDITAFDGELKTKETVIITVINVDRAPVLTLSSPLEVKENEELKWKVAATDPDDDKLEITFLNAPTGSNFKRGVFTWTPSYDFIKRKGGFISNVLNNLRLEQVFLKKRTINLQVKVCGQELCTEGEIPVVVYNVNRKPILEDLNPIYVSETDEVLITPTAIDPDGDKVNYYFTEPLNKRTGKWQTGYEDEGVYTTYLTATDGKDGVTVPININIDKQNRPPTLIIKDDDLVVNEGQEFTLRVKAEDPDDDNLIVTLKNITAGASFSNGVFIWEPSYSTVLEKKNTIRNDLVSELGFLNRKLNTEKTVRWLEFVVSDGEFEVNHPVKVTIKNRNKAPTITESIPQNRIRVTQNQPVLFQANADDEDQDKLEYTWSFGLQEARIKGTTKIERVFIEPGVKKVKLQVSDGRDSTEKEWFIEVIEEEEKEVSEPVEVKTYQAYVIEV